MDSYWKGKEVLITGATGFIGSNAVDFFLKKGAHISAVISPKATAQELQKKLGKSSAKVRTVKVDLRNAEDVHKITKNRDIILHFAAVDGGMKFKKDHSEEIYQQNTSVTNNLLKAAVLSNVKKFLLLSSADVYDGDQTKPITEDKAGNPSWTEQKDGYKLAKWQTEHDAIEIAKNSHLDIIIVRPSNIYGPKDNFDDESKIRFIPAIINNIFAKEKPITIWGDGTQIKSFLYVEDFLQICSLLIEKNVSGTPINVASKQYITLKELAEKVVDLSGMRKEILVDPAKPSGPSKRIIDTSLLTNKVGSIRETTLDTGLKKTIEYFMSLPKDV